MNTSERSRYAWQHRPSDADASELPDRDYWGADMRFGAQQPWTCPRWLRRILWGIMLIWAATIIANNLPAGCERLMQ